MKKIIQIFVLVFYNIYKKKEPDIAFYSAVGLFSLLFFVNLCSILYMLDIHPYLEINHLSRAENYLIFMALLLILSLLLKYYLNENETINLQFEDETYARYKLFSWLYVGSTIGLYILGLII